MSWQRGALQTTIDVEIRERMEIMRMKWMVTYNPEFYVMKHLAHFVAPGSVRLDLQGPWSGNALAFQTPDRSTVVVCANPFSEHVEVVMDVASDRFLLRLDAHSFNTLVLDG